MPLLNLVPRRASDASFTFLVDTPSRYISIKVVTRASSVRW